MFNVILTKDILSMLTGKQAFMVIESSIIAWVVVECFKASYKSNDNSK